MPDNNSTTSRRSTHSGRTRRLPALITQAQADRFWSYVDIRGDDECWPWLGSLNIKSNYGQFGLNSELRAVRASRLAFRLFYGGDPYPCDICHRCDNRQCCNPHHFFLGAMRVTNNADRHAKGRTARGEQLPQSKLTAQDIPDIDRRHAAKESMRSIALSKHVNTTAIFFAVHRITWKHIPKSV
jgi:hypothetical protein